MTAGPPRGQAPFSQPYSNRARTLEPFFRIVIGESSRGFSRGRWAWSGPHLHPFPFVMWKDSMRISLTCCGCIVKTPLLFHPLYLHPLISPSPPPGRIWIKEGVCWNLWRKTEIIVPVVAQMRARNALSLDVTNERSSACSASLDTDSPCLLHHRQDLVCFHFTCPHTCFGRSSGFLA